MVVMVHSIWEEILPPQSEEIRLTVVVPTYNEADNLPRMAAALFALPIAGLQLLVVDDNSPDGTGDVADQLAAAYNGNPDSADLNGGDPAAQRPRMVVLHRKGKGGLGTAYVDGMNLALTNGADFVVQMDADFSHSPDYMPRMLGVLLSTNADVVVGSRYVPGGSLDEGWGLWRRFVSWWANLYSRLILGLRIRDMTAGFKLWQRRCVAGHRPGERAQQRLQLSGRDGLSLRKAGLPHHRNPHPF